jgi:signal transduction histidine kinase/ligand-binding sensor domain-containing protein
LNPAYDVSQYAHTSWKYRDGLAKGEVHSIAQTLDGWLWLGTEFGLMRFDGVKSTPWEPPAGQRLPSPNITPLIAARDGTLWIGTRNGLASWKNGKLTQYADLAGQAIFALLEDREGIVWVGAYGLPNGKFCEIRSGAVLCHSEMGGLGPGVLGLHEDAQGNLWVGLRTGLWRWKPGPPQFYSLLQPDGIQAMATGEDGKILISSRGMVSGLADGKFIRGYPLPGKKPPSYAPHLLRDRDGGLWGGTLTAGIVHWHQGRADVFSETDGLSSDHDTALFEDREGNVWVGTTKGLDRFRELPAVTFSMKQGLSSPPAGPALAARDGSVWFTTNDALNRLQDGQLVAYRPSRASVSAGVREIVVAGLPEAFSGTSLTEDSRGRIWLASRTGVGYLESGRFVSTAVPGGVMTAISEDSGGNLWIANQDRGLFRWSERNSVERVPWETFGRGDPADTLLPARGNGGTWLGFFRGGIAWLREGKVRASYSVNDGLGAGRVSELRFDGEGVLWAATEGGLSRLEGGRIVTLSGKNGLPCEAVHWSLEDDDRAVWLMMGCGLVQIARADLSAWQTSPDPTAGKIHPTVFDDSDGVVGRPVASGQTPHAGKSPDGKLWFFNADGVGVVDPRHLPVNKLPPPVAIGQITADRKTYAPDAQLRLPPLVRDLEIDYTALSFVAPEKIRFQYKLEGHDRDWEDVSNRRQAFYTDLPPRRYRFRVRAANNSGVWNEAGASLDFSVAPAYYQTTWFFSLCIAAGLASLAGLYRLRVQYMRRQFSLTLDARVAERTRIARDLHDTLLQSFQGVLLKLSSLRYIIPDRPAEAVESLEVMMDQARAAITEGRDAVQGLRSSTIVANDLARAIVTFGDNIAADYAGAPLPEFRVHVEGQSRDLAPLVRDEVYKIASESLRNAFRHAQARRIEVEVRYDPRQFRLRVVDDGKGIDPAVLSAGGRAGHHGLPGLHERAKLAGGKLSLWSLLGSGTEIELTIPAAIAYAKQAAGQSFSAGKETG